MKKRHRGSERRFLVQPDCYQCSDASFGPINQLTNELDTFGHLADLDKFIRLVCLLDRTRAKNNAWNTGLLEKPGLGSERYGPRFI